MQTSEGNSDLTSSLDDKTIIDSRTTTRKALVFEADIQQIKRRKATIKACAVCTRLMRHNT
jgi:hypothetical protein